MTQSGRPLSPHLQIYKPQLTSVLSILHRITGVVAFLGSFCLLVWLIALAWDASLYGFLQAIVGSIPIQVMVFLWTLALVFHLCNGIRHLLWDAGKGFSLAQIYLSGKWVMGVSLVVTSLIWITK